MMPEKGLARFETFINAISLFSSSFLYVSRFVFVLSKNCGGYYLTLYRGNLNTRFNKDVFAECTALCYCYSQKLGTRLIKIRAHGILQIKSIATAPS